MIKHSVKKGFLACRKSLEDYTAEYIKLKQLNYYYVVDLMCQPVF